MNKLKENVSSVALGFVFFIVVFPGIFLFLWGAGRVFSFLTGINIDSVFFNIYAGILAITMLVLMMSIFCATLIFLKDTGEEIKKSIKRRKDIKRWKD